MLRRRSESRRPWLFYRDGIDWQWLSHRQAAVRVARTAEALRTAAQRDTAETLTLQAEFDIETLVAAMASRLVGVPIRHLEQAANEPSAAPFVPPPAPQHFESAESPTLPDPERPFPDAPAVEALLDVVGNSPTGNGHRPVVFAAPPGRSLEGPSKLLETVAAATLSLDAAWALEPMAEAFVATARWVRPTILLAPIQALDALAEAWDESDGRWSRLEVVVAVSGDRGVPEGRIAHWSKVFGCPVRSWQNR